MKTVRQNLYLEARLIDDLKRLATLRGSNKSRVVNDALVDMLDRQRTKELDNLFKSRLDQISRDMNIARRDIDILLEAISLFVRYQLTVTAPLPDSDPQAMAIGEERYNRFIGQLGRQIKSDRRTLKSLRSGDAS